MLGSYAVNFLDHNQNYCNKIALANNSINTMVRAWVMVFNVNFNNILVISWRSVLLVEETRVHRENHQPVANH